MTKSYRYQISMFAAGFGNMLIEAPLIFLITRELSASYATSIGLTGDPIRHQSVVVTALGALSRSGSRRTVSCPQSVLWVLAQVLTLVGALLGSIAWLAISRVVMGVAMRRQPGLAAWSQRLCAR